MIDEQFGLVFQLSNMYSVLFYYLFGTCLLDHLNLIIKNVELF